MKNRNARTSNLPLALVALLGAGLALPPTAGAALQLSALRCEYLVNPLGVQEPAPRLGWLAESAARGDRQTAYQVLVAATPEALAADRGDLWDSGKVESEENAHVAYAGKPLASRQACCWKVRAWDRDDQPGAWSAPASWEMGLLKADDWKARWIEAVCAADGKPAGSLEGATWIWFPEPGADLKAAAPAGQRFFRRSVTLPAGAKVKDAQLTVTVDDQYTLFVNGRKIDARTEPHGWRQPQTYDVSGALAPGANVLALSAKNIENAAGVCVRLELRFADGKALAVPSDKQWKTATRSAPDWNTTSFDDTAWAAAAEIAPFGQGVWGKVAPGAAAAPVPILRKTLKLSDQPVARARLYATALGVYELRLNGQRVGDHLLAPEWTDYAKRIRTETYDVTALLRPGDNALAGLLGHGWYSGHIGNGGYQRWGKVPALLAQLEVTYRDGTVERVVTDESWKIHASPLLASDMMAGETYDAQLEIAKWDEPGLDDGAWKPAVVREEAPRPLEAQVCEPVRRTGELAPKALTEPAPGRWTFDLGQNMVGWARLKVEAPTGTRVVLRFAEMLNPDGTIYTTNLRGARCVDTYVCKGGGVETWEPRFTFHGFRYIEVSGLPGKPAPGTVTGIVIGSDTPRTGEFACSDPRLNQLMSNIQWGQRGNYLSAPTDCPQRDERLGWMGDAQVFVRTATDNADVAAFFTKWLVDVDDAQTPDGAFTDVSPRVGSREGTPAWGDAGVICPWTIYRVYGDTRLLERHYPAMVRWVEWCRAHSKELIREKDLGGNYGDWLSIGADTPKDLIGTAYFAYSTHLVAKAARVLGKAEEAAKYEKLFADIRAAFNAKYVAEDGRIRGNTQCVYLMALKFELLPEPLRAKAARYLEEDIQAKGWHLSTGFVGVSYMLPVLTAAGKVDTAYRLMLQDSFPSWLFSVKHGATTIWERWDGWTPDKGFQNPGMNSFNHYSLGSCGEWMYDTLAGLGLDPAVPGYRHLVIHPRAGGGLTSARASLLTVRGKAASAWTLDAKASFTLDCTVPVGATATVILPAASAAAVTEGGRPLAQVKDVAVKGAGGGEVTLEVGSGAYRFVCPK